MSSRNPVHVVKGKSRWFDFYMPSVFKNIFALSVVTVVTFLLLLPTINFFSIVIMTKVASYLGYI